MCGKDKKRYLGVGKHKNITLLNKKNLYKNRELGIIIY